LLLLTSTRLAKWRPDPMVKQTGVDSRGCAIVENVRSEDDERLGPLGPPDTLEYFHEKEAVDVLDLLRFSMLSPSQF
jgi:hypothetical protein